MRLNAALGRDRDITYGPQVYTNITTTAGSASDSANTIFVNPSMRNVLVPTNSVGTVTQAGNLPVNALQLRQAVYTPDTAVTAGATNFYDLRLNVWRWQPGLATPARALAGVLGYYTLQVTTTLGTAITSANQGSVVAVTATSMTGIMPGMQLNVDPGVAAKAEVVTVLSTTSTTFSAYFVNLHATSAPVTSSLVADNPVVFTPAYGGVSSGATIPAIGSTGSQAVTPNAVNGTSGMYGIHLGDGILVSDSASTETVIVTAISATQFTATFANTHGSGKSISTATLGNAQNPAIFVIQGGDSISLARVSSNSTGLLSVQGLIALDLSTSASVGGI